MSKFRKFVIIMIALFCFASCSDKKVENVKEKDEFDLKTAEKVVENYFEYVINDEFEKCNELLDNEMKIDFRKEINNKIKMTSYKITEMNESDRTGEIGALVLRSEKIRPESLLDEYKIKVVKRGIDYKIGEVNIKPYKEAFYIDGELRIRKENSVDTNLIVNMEDIPEFVYSKDDKAKINIKTIPKSNFGFINFSYEGSKLAMSTFDETGCFIGIVTIDDTIETQAKEDGDGDEKQSQKDSQKIQKGLREKPVGKEILSFDFLTNSTVQNMAFSLDEKMIVVQYKTEDDKNCFRVYNINSGDMIPVKFEEEYPLNKVDVVFKKFDKEKLTYKVTAKDNTQDHNEYTGVWQMELENNKLKKINAF